MIFPIFNANNETESQRSYVTCQGHAASKQHSQPGGLWVHAFTHYTMQSCQGNVNSNKIPFSIQQIGKEFLNIGNIKCW